MKKKKNRKSDFLVLPNGCRYDPSFELDDLYDWIGTEKDRVAFLKSIAHAMASKARITLNLKRLYSADGYAVRELLKIATVLNNANQKARDAIESETHEAPDQKGAPSYGIQTSEARRLASEMTEVGGRLYDALKEEAEDLQQARKKAIGKDMDVGEVERRVKEAIATVEESIKSTEGMVEDARKDEQNLETKLEKRKGELERAEKRVESLKKVRPQYMDEYEELHGELERMYAEYVEKQRNVDYLEAEIERRESEERKTMRYKEKQLRKMQEKLRDEYRKMLRGDDELADDAKPTLDKTPLGTQRPDTAGRAALRERRANQPYTKVKREDQQTENVKGSLVNAQDAESSEESLSDVVQNEESEEDQESGSSIGNENEF